ncbi:sensor histidine kinase [Salipiger marinus]|uniref:sensor histidine kinase n=1 Tax=Salipiger marinus TaxID=555512 RepID=UPI001E3E82FE|nr:ATP-binding protein [Salipiger manganoxidans]MCD1619189.1 hypothetical protein [Salipiger manganoxidans]MEB3419398.1 ATP-binding protein [Salipiger manganoxidans]
MADGTFIPGLVPPQDRLRDFTLFRRLERFRPSELLVSGLMLGSVVALLAVHYGQQLMIYWYGLFLVTRSLHFLAVETLPDRGPPRLLVLPMATMVLSGLIYMAGGLLLWVQATPALHSFSLGLLFVSVLNTLSIRSHLRLLLRVDLGLIATGCTARVGWLWLTDPGSLDTLGLTLMIGFGFLYFVKVAMDVTRLREVLDARAEQALQSARRRAFEQLTGGVAHDFNNLLTAVLGNMELARLTEGKDEREELMEAAEQAARHGAELTGRLLTLSSRARLQPARVTPAEVARQLADLAGPLLHPTHRLRCDLPRGLPPVQADPSKLTAALMELVRNARDALPCGGEITLRAQAGRGEVTFEIGDGGSGIRSEVLPMVLEPYFTTKPVGQGSGLGLAMVRGFAEQSGGRIELSSTLGKGTRVRLILPEAPS